MTGNRAGEAKCWGPAGITEMIVMMFTALLEGKGVQRKLAF